MITKAVEILKKGKIVALPTETVYGLAVDMFNEGAIKRLYEIKKRDKKKPFAIAISGIKELKKFVRKIPKKAILLIRKFWPGPLTLILLASDNVPSHLISNGKIGIRNPRNKTTLKIIKRLGNPIVLTSVNVSGEKSCVTADEIKKTFDKYIDVIVKTEEEISGIESTVVDLSDSKPKILREGSISEEEITICLHRK